MEESFGLQDYGDKSAIQSVDPVCGMPVDENHAAGKLEYAGQIYYFCSPDCQKNFQLEPGIYIGQHH
jgi:YHS domain-containing protein